MTKNNEIDSSINIVSIGTDVTGDIKLTGDIRIDGSVKGNLNTKGKVVIGPTGKVYGEIVCKNTEISGLIEGRIVVGQLLVLKATSKILGDIETSKLSIEPGAIFSGTCKMGENGNYGGTSANREQEKPSK
jgi:cytoskeletal protein CcmA (bactofilin family)